MPSAAARAARVPISASGSMRRNSQIYAPQGEFAIKDLDRNVTMSTAIKLKTRFLGCLVSERARRPPDPVRADPACGGTGFFDLYPRFYSTSKTGATPNRLNHRHQALIQTNTAVIRGQSVLDIASHDGRWSFAAHKAGARHVLGIEARPHLVDLAELNMREYGAPSDCFRFVLGDFFEEVERLEPFSIDAVFCFGFFYHTTNHMLLLSKILRLAPRNLIVDTTVDSSLDNIIRLWSEDASIERNAARGDSGDLAHSLIGIPSKSAVESMLRASGLSPTYYDWQRSNIQQWDGLEDYRDGRRISFVARVENPMRQSR